MTRWTMIRRTDSSGARSDPEKRVRILRVIARLNMGGPALHVAYLTEGLTKRGYDTTLVAGSLARGEDSMAFVADARGVEIVRIDELGREISPLRDLLATIRLARLIRKERPQILHTHTAKAGTVGRVAARLAGSRKPPIVVHTLHGHVLRGYFGPVRTLLFRLLERWLAARTTALIAVSRRFGDDLSLRRRARGASSSFAHRWTNASRQNRTVAPRAGAISAFPATVSPWAGSAG
jgi:glycosyltransferase involved in cell wall biosynthesis